VPELGVVVVLEDGGVVLPGPPQQLHPPGSGHDCPERKLVRRRDVDEAGNGRDCVDDDAVAVHRHRHDVKTVRAKQFVHRRVSGLLHGGHVAWRGQDPGEQVHGVRRAGRDHDLLWGRCHAAGHGEPTRDRCAQVLVAGRVAVVRRRAARRVRAAASPGRGRERGWVDAPNAQVVGRDEVRVLLVSEQRLVSAQ
jgi:hypothetical protein